jgi:hypothetical protein
MDFLVVATTLGIVAAVWGGVLVLLIAWRGVGRRRPECIHPSLVRLLESDGAFSEVVMCLACEDEMVAPLNGASSSGATGTSGDVKNG